MLVLVDYATRYPEAMPLHNISAKSVVQALFSDYLLCWHPERDSGMDTTQTVRIVGNTFYWKTVCTIPKWMGWWNGLIETLKSMILKFVHDDSWNWGRCSSALSKFSHDINSVSPIEGLNCEKIHRESPSITPNL